EGVARPAPLDRARPEAHIAVAGGHGLLAEADDDIVPIGHAAFGPDAGGGAGRLAGGKGGDGGRGGGKADGSLHGSFPRSVMEGERRGGARVPVKVQGYHARGRSATRGRSAQQTAGDHL